MAPHPAPTPTPTVPPATGITSETTVLPLTTIWTPPSSCLNAIPTLVAASCISGICDSYSVYESPRYAANNPVLWTLGNVQASTTCTAPSMQYYVDFYYSPAVGCPASYSIVTAIPLTSGEAWVACCPSSYGATYHTTSESTYVSCRRAVRTGEVMHAIALGEVTVYDASGSLSYEYDTVRYLYETTITSVSVVSGLSVYTNPIFMVIPSSLVTASLSITATATPTSAAHGKPKYQAFGLNFTYSIVVTVVIGVVGLITLWCLLLCMGGVYRSIKRSLFPVYPPCEHSVWMRCNRQRKGKCCVCSSPPTRTWILFDGGLDDFCLPCQQGWYRRLDSFPRKCGHKEAWSCGTSNLVCCACTDTRTQKLSFETRMSTYCYGCLTNWQSPQHPVFPMQWLPFPPCEHPVVSQCIGASLGRCCCCNDRNRMKVPLRDRVSNYCAACAGYWLATTRSTPYPTHWLPFPCQHSASCAQLQNGQCCECNDLRPEKMTINARVHRFCPYCRPRVLQVYSSGNLSMLPSIWQPFPIPCKHVQMNICSNASQGTCCICRDDRNKSTQRKPVRGKKKGQSPSSDSDICKTCVSQEGWRIVMRTVPESKALETLVPLCSPYLEILQKGCGPQYNQPLLTMANLVRIWKAGMPIPQASTSRPSNGNSKGEPSSPGPKVSDKTEIRGTRVYGVEWVEPGYRPPSPLGGSSRSSRVASRGKRSNAQSSSRPAAAKLTSLEEFQKIASGMK